jgi:hypothetical protein
MAKRFVSRNLTSTRYKTIVLNGSGSTGPTAQVTVSGSATDFETLDKTNVVVSSKSSGINVFLWGTPVFSGNTYTFVVKSSEVNADFNYLLVTVGNS